jgi:hypothetical protein
MEEWIRHLEVLARPVLLPASLDAFPALLTSLSEQPRFDAIVGMDMLHKTSQPQALLRGLQPFVGSQATLVWAESNLARSQGFTDLLPSTEMDATLLAKVDALEKEWRQSLPQSPLQELCQSLADKNGFQAVLEGADFLTRKHFTQTQIHNWFSASATERPDSLLAKLSLALSVRERTALEASLVQVLSERGVEWRASYDFLKVKFTER